MIYAAIYARQSSDEGAKKNLSIPSQIMACKKHIELHGYTLFRIYKDEGISGSHLARPALQAMLKDGKRGIFQRVIIYDVSRISRRTIEANVLEYEFQKHNIAMEYLDMEGIDLTIRPIIKSVMQAFAELHSRQSSKKTKEGMIENIRNGYSNGGTPPFGYKSVKKEVNGVERSKIVIDRKLKEPLINYFKMRLNGYSISEGQKYLEGEGIYKKLSFFAEMERNALFFAGYGIWNKANHRKKKFDGSEYFENGSRYRDKSDWVIVEDHHPAMISEKEAEKIIKLKKSFKRTKDVLSGKVLCPICKKVMWLHSPKRLACPEQHFTIYRAPIKMLLKKYIESKFLNREYLRKLLLKNISSKDSEKSIEVLQGKVIRMGKRIDNLSAAISKARNPLQIIEKYDSAIEKREELNKKLDEIQRKCFDEKDVQSFIDHLLSSYTGKQLSLIISKYNFTVNLNNYNSKYHRRKVVIGFDFSVGKLSAGSRT